MCVCVCVCVHACEDGRKVQHDYVMRNQAHDTETLRNINEE